MLGGRFLAEIMKHDLLEILTLNLSRIKAKSAKDNQEEACNLQTSDLFVYQDEGHIRGSVDTTRKGRMKHLL